MNDFDTDKVDDAVLALMYLTMHYGGILSQAWKGPDWKDAMERLHRKGYIGNPKSKAKSVAVTDEGKARAKELFCLLFGMQS
jgi:hypothetical protein